jgi:hypothetical protein
LLFIQRPSAIIVCRSRGQRIPLPKLTQGASGKLKKNKNKGDKKCLNKN